MSAVLAVFQFAGNSADLLDRYDKLLHRVVEVSSARPLIHLAIPVDAGLTVYDVWDSEEVFRSFYDNREFHDVLEQFGMANPTVDVHPVHNLGWPVSAVPLYR
jgi:hypothetical protein